MTTSVFYTHPQNLLQRTTLLTCRNIGVHYSRKTWDKDIWWNPETLCLLVQLKYKRSRYKSFNLVSLSHFWPAFWIWRLIGWGTYQDYLFSLIVQDYQIIINTQCPLMILFWIACLYSIIWGTKEVIFGFTLGSNSPGIPHGHTNQWNFDFLVTAWYTFA